MRSRSSCWTVFELLLLDLNRRNPRMRSLSTSGIRGMNYLLNGFHTVFSHCVPSFCDVLACQGQVNCCHGRWSVRA
jgi:hypothetical protein